MDQEVVKEQLRSGGDEFHYRDANCDIGGDLISPEHLEVKHFVVKRDARNQGIASTLLSCLIAVLREEDIYTLTIEMGATECYTMEELEDYREEHDGDDPTAEFLRGRGFTNVTPKETFQWGLVFRGTRSV